MQRFSEQNDRQNSGYSSHQRMQSEARRVMARTRTMVIKIGTEIVHSADDLLALGQIGAIVEQIAILHMQGIKVILVTSGAVAIGRMVLQRQYLLSGSMQSHLDGQVGEKLKFYEKACASAGQSGLQSLYELLFAQYHLASAQVLASDADFAIPDVRQHLRDTIFTLLDNGVIPVINENDVISRRTVPLREPAGTKKPRIAWDNDSLASLFAQEIHVDVMVILTDVNGVYRASADGKDKVLIKEFKSTDVPISLDESRVGNSGQKDKIHACISAIESGRVRSAIITKAEPTCLLQIAKGEPTGTLFNSQTYHDTKGIESVIQNDVKSKL